MTDSSLNDRLRSAGVDELSAEEIAAMQEHPVLTLRQLPSGSGFVRTINCSVDRLTVIHGEYETAVRPFRDALTGRTNPIPVATRYGSRELHTSEVHIVDGEPLPDDEIVADLLEACGASARSVRSLLATVGLEEVSYSRVRDLTDCARRRLAILCSFFSRSKVVLYDRPFAPIEPVWVEQVAHLMVESARSGKRVAIVTGIDEIPESWRSSSNVVFENVVDRETRRGLAALGKRERKGTGSIKALMQGSRSVLDENEKVIITRPQSVTVGRVRGEDVMKIEAIPNPNLVSFVPPFAQEPGYTAPLTLSAEAGGAAVRPRKNTGKLTRVTRSDAFRRFVVNTGLGRVWKRGP